MKPQKSKAMAKRRGIGVKLMRKDDLVVVPHCVEGNMVFWGEPTAECTRPQDGPNVTASGIAWREG
jgi:hypothetical protein